MNFGLRLFKQLYKQPLARLYSTKLPSEYVIFQDNDLIICWHKPEPFPYECSKPLPAKVPEPEGVLKVSEIEVNKLFKRRNEAMIPEELARITYTTKHRWYPRARDKRAKKTPRDRPYM